MASKKKDSGAKTGTKTTGAKTGGKKVESPFFNKPVTEISNANKFAQAVAPKTENKTIPSAPKTQTFKQAVESPASYAKNLEGTPSQDAVIRANTGKTQVYNTGKKKTLWEEKYGIILPKDFMKDMTSVQNPYAGNRAVDAGNEAAALEARALTGEDRNPDHQKIADLKQEAEVNSSPYVKAYREAKNPKGRKETAAKFRKDNADELYLKPMLEGAKADYQRNKQKMPNGANADEYLRKIAPYRLRSKENKLTETEKREIAAIAEPFITRIDSGRFNSDDAKKLKKYLSAIADRVPDDDIAGSGFINALKNRVDSAGAVAKKRKEEERINEEYEKYIAPVLSNPRTYYLPKDAKAEDYIKAAFEITNKMKSIGPSMNSRGASSSDETKKQLYSIIEQFIKKYPDQNNELKMYGILNDYGNIDGTYSEEDKKFIDYLKNKVQNEAGLAKAEKQKAKEQEEYDKYIAPVLSNPRTYYFPKDAKPSDYIRAAQKITNKMKWDGTSSDETKKQLYSIVEQFMLKYPDPDSKLLDKELRGEGRTKEECYLNMRYILGDRPGRSDGSYSEEDKKFVEYLSKKLSNEINITKADRQLEKAEEKNILWSGENSEGEKITLYRDKNFFNSNWKVGNYGIISSRMGDMYAKTGDKRFYDVALKFKQLSEGVAGSNYEDINPDNIFLNIAANGLQNFPLQLDQLKETGKIAAPLALLAVATGVGTIGGALKLAYTAGSVKSGFEIMRGDAMVSLTEMGLSYDDALKLANNEGFINTFIESGDAVLDIISLGAGGALMKETVASLTGGVKKGAARAAAKGLLKLGISEKGVKTILKGAAAAGAFALNVAGEGGEEWLQTSVSLANEDAAEAILSGDSNAGYESASNLANRAFTRDYTKEEKAQRREDFWGGVKGGLFFSGAHIAAGAAGGTIMNFAGNKAMNIIAGKDIVENKKELTLIQAAELIDDSKVREQKEKIEERQKQGEKVSNEEWGKLANLVDAVSAERVKSEIAEEYKSMGKTSNLTFEQVKEAMAKNPYNNAIDEGDAFLAFTKGRYEKRKEKPGNKALNEIKEEAEKAGTFEEEKRRAATRDRETAPKNKGKHRDELLKNTPKKNRAEADYYYSLGLAGEDIESIFNEPYAEGVFTDEQRRDAWNAGKTDRTESAERKAKQNAFRPGIQADALTLGSLKDVDKATIRAIDKVYKKLGSSLRVKDIVYSGSEKDAVRASVGGITKDGGRLAVISATATHKKLKGAERIRYFAMHESVHIAAQTDPKVYNTLSERITKINPEIFTDERIKEKIEEYAKSGIEIDSESAREEIVAEYIGEALAKSDRKTLHKIIGDRRNVAEVLLDLVNKLINLFRNDKELRKGYEKAREAIVEAINDIDKERAAHHEEGGTGSAKTDESVKYAVNDDYKKEIDSWYKSGKSKNESFILGSTGDVLQGLGAIESDIYINSEKVLNILEKHKEITIDEIKKIPDIIENPVLILKSKNKDRGGKQNTRLIIYGSVKGKDGRPVLSVLDLRPVENNLAINDMQKVSSVYTKDNNPVAFIENSDVVYADKKRTANLLHSIGFQMPTELRHSGYIGSISYRNDFVNIQGKKFSDVFDVTVNTQYMQKGKKYAVSDDQGAEKITVKDVRAVQSVGRKSVNDFTSEDIKKTGGFAKRYFKEMGAKSPFFRAWFGDWRANDTSKITVADRKGAARGKIKNRDTGWDIQVSRKVFDETSMHRSEKATSGTPYLDYINSIVENAVLLDSYAIPENKAKSPNSVMMHSLYAIADMGKGKELVKLYIEELNDVNSDGTMKRAYQLQNIENQQSGVIGSGNIPSQITQTADVNTVSQLFNLVKQKDKNFRPKEVNSAFLNEDGTPKVFYHGTNEKWTKYDLGKNVNQMWGEGIYLTPDPERAKMYGDNVMAFYVKADTDYRKAKATGAQRDYTVIKNTGDVIVYSPNQIKSATDNIGTFDPGNDDTHYAVSDEETGSGGDEKKEKYFKPGKNRARDINVRSETDNGKTARFTKTVLESQFTPDEIADRLLEDEIESRAAYAQYSDQSALDKANSWFEGKNSDLDLAADDVESDIEKGQLVTKDAFARAQLIINKLLNAVKEESDEYEKERLYRRAQTIIIDTALAGTKAGQAVQAMSMLKKLSPEGRLIVLKKSVDALNEENRKGRKKVDTQTDESLNRRIKRADKSEKEKLRDFKKLDLEKTEEELHREKMRQYAKRLLEARKALGQPDTENKTLLNFMNSKEAEHYAVDDSNFSVEQMMETEDFSKFTAEELDKMLESLITEVEESDKRMASLDEELRTAKEELRIARVGRELLEDFRKKIYEEAHGKELEIPKEVEAQILEARNTDDLDTAIASATKIIADQIPARLFDRKWRNAWRYMSMLLNPTTHERNFLSNTVMFLTAGMKDVIAGAISDIAYMNDKDAERYNSLTKMRLKDKATRKWIRETVWESVAPYIDDAGQSKTKDNYMNAIMRAVKPFKFRITNNISEFNSMALEWEDNLALKWNFVRAMKRYMAANDVTMETITTEQLENAKAHAAKEAREATFHDLNRFAQQIGKMAKKHPLAGELFFGGNLPFTKTPFNIAKRAIEYSPIEFALVATKKYKGGAEYSKADVINDVSKGITGSMMIGLGMLFYSLGWVHVSGDDDEDYEKEKGVQNFSVRIGNYSYTIDWLQPACIPLLSGALIMKMIDDSANGGENGGIEDLSFNDVIKIALEVTEQVFEPLIQTSVLSGLDDALEAVRDSNSDSETIVNLMKQTVFNYFGQYVPTVVGKITKTFDPSTRRTIYVSPDSPVPDLEYFAKKQASKLPGLSRLNSEYVDLFGETAPRKEGAGDYALSFLQNMLSPGYARKITLDDTDDELLRLSGTAAADGKKVLNYRPKKTVNIDIGGHTEKRALTEDEYFEIKKKMGQYGTAAIRELIKSDVYKNMSDEARAEATDFIWKTAETKAKADVVPDFYMSKEERIAQTLSGGDPEKLALWSAALAKEKLEEEEAKPDYTAEQQRKYDSSLEERFSALSDELTASPYWEDKSDEEKHDALTDLYGYSAAKARSEVEEGYELSGQNKKIASVEEKTGISPAEYLAYKLLEENADTDGSGTLNQKETSAALSEFALQNGASLSDVAFLWQMETDGVSKNNPWAAYLDPKYYKHSGKERKTWDR